MSLKNAAPAIFVSLVIVLSASHNPISKPDHNNTTADTTKQVIDALRVRFDTKMYKTNIFTNILEISNLLSKFKMGPTVVETTALKNGVRYVLSNGDNIERIGGTIAWRNNNPGCIRYSAHAVELGATGRANGFAIFPDEGTGMRAIGTLLRSEKYRDLSIGAAITKYAPPHENDTDSYIKKLCNMTGLSNNLKIRDLNDEQMTRVVNAIRIIEGWIVGTETKTAAPKITSTSAAQQYSNAQTLRKQLTLIKLEHTL